MELTNLKKLREKSGITQADLADKLFVSAQSVSKWENGISEPDLATVFQLADIFSVSIDTLLGRETLYKDDIDKKLCWYLKKSESFFDDALETMHSMMASKLGDGDGENVYSYFMSKNSLFTYSKYDSSPTVSVISKNLDRIFDGNEGNYVEYLSAIADKNVLAFVSRLDRLDNRTDYDTISLCEAMETPEDVFINIKNKLILAGIVSECSLEIDGKDYVVYRKKNITGILSIYAFANQIFVQRPSGSRLELNKRG